MLASGMRRKVVGVAAMLALAVGGSVTAALPASAATPYAAGVLQPELPLNNTFCSYGTYASFLAWAFGAETTVIVPAGHCITFPWPAAYGDAYVWGEYSPGNYFLIGSPASEGNIYTYGDEGPGDYHWAY